MAADQKVQLSLTMRTRGTLSIRDPFPAEPLQLIITIKQTASPLPDRPVAVLTKYCCLDNTPGEDAFRLRNMCSPHIIPPDAPCLAPELRLHPGSTTTHIRVGGDPDLLKRPKEDGWHDFTFLTVPPVGQGHAEATFTLPPSRLVCYVGLKEFPREFGGGRTEDPSITEAKLLRYLRPGDTYGIPPPSVVDLKPERWAFGSLEGEEGLRKKMVTRRSFPDDLPLVRAEGDDETDEVAKNMKDYVQRCRVNLRTGERKPNIREMRCEGWVFGEPQAGIVMTVDEEHSDATFALTE